MAGAPVGNDNAVRGKRWRDAVGRAIEAWPNEPDSTGCSDMIRGLNAAAHTFVKKMMGDQDISFFREFGDRLDGKPAQVIAGDPDAPIEQRIVHESR